MIPYLDLKAQYESIKDELNAAATRVLASTHYILGEEVAAFEREFANYTHTRHAVGLNSGTSALHLALLAVGVKPGDEVITVSFTFIATASAIVYAQARPVFVDVCPDTLTLDPALLERAITPRTKAIIPVHIHGQMADMGPILAIAKRHGLAVIEDAAQAHGANYQGGAAGSLGDVGCFSFYPGKNLGACGEGGGLVTNSDPHAQLARTLRDWGQTQRYHHDLLGYNFRMDGIQGALLRVKLRRLDQWTQGRREAAARYDRLLAELPVGRPHEASGRRHVYHVYAIRTDRRDQVQARLNEAKIGNGIHYPIPVHLQKCMAYLGYRAGDFPVTEAAAAEVLSLPMYPELSEASQLEVRDVLAAALR